MSTWTWSIYRADLIPRKQLNIFLKKEIKHLTTSNIVWRSFEDYIKFYKKHKKYLMKELGYTEERVVKESSEDHYNNKREYFQHLADIFKKILDEELPIQDLLNYPEFVKEYEFNPQVKIIDGKLFLGMDEELFRLRVYSEEHFTTVEDLISHLKKFDGQNKIMDFDDPSMTWGDLTPKLEARLRKHYGEIGDGNFDVHFG